MPRSKLSDRRILVLGFVVFCLIVTAQAWARNQAQPRPEAVLVEDQPPDPHVHLEATMRDDVIVGSVTAFRKDGRPRTDAGGNVRLLNAGGERAGQVPLDLTGPGQFRFILSTDRLEPGGHLEVYLPGGGQVSEERLLYRVGLDGEAASWVLSTAKGVKPMSVGATEGPDAFGYTWDDTAVFDWVDASGGPSISLRDDYWVGPFDIGFDFKFYGRTYGEFYVDSNGYIGFNGAQTASYPGNGSLKDASRPNSIIAPFWDDLDPSRGGTVRYRTLGSAPNRRLVVSWRDVPLSDSVSDLQSFQVILHEDSNDITFQYPDTREGILGDGSSATIGIVNEDGTIALAYPLLIPINVSHAIHFDYGQQPYNTFVTPKRLGGIVAAGEEASFPLKIKNLGYNSDSFSVERLEFEGSDWAINFYEADGTTPLADNETGPIEPGDEREIVIKVDVPEDAEVGESARAEVRADSENYDTPTPSPTPETPTPTATPETPTPTPTQTRTPTPEPKWVEIWPDRGEGASYCLGDEIALCLEMSGPMHLRLWVTTSDGRRLIDEWYDDGRSWCKDGTIGEPVGEHRYRIEAVEDGQVVAWDETWVWVERCEECATHRFAGEVTQRSDDLAPSDYGFIVEVTYVWEDSSELGIDVGDEVLVWAEEAAIEKPIPQPQSYVHVSGHAAMVPCIPYCPYCDALGIRVEVDCDEYVWYGPHASRGGAEDLHREGDSAVYLSTGDRFAGYEAGRDQDSFLPRYEDEFRPEEQRGSLRAKAGSVEMPSQSDSGHDDTSVDVVVGTTFAQVYTDNESGDGTEDPENYFDPVQEGKQTPRRVTTDEDESSYAAVATMPDGNAVNVWNTSYYNGTTWVEEINYAILDPSGSFVLPVTRLTDNSSADEATYDFSASADIAPNGNLAIAWAQQQDTEGDLAYDRSNARYVVVSRRGGVLRPPTFLTNNTGNYPRDYPPAVAALTSGRFLLAWEHAASPSGPVDIYYAVLSNDGSIARPKTRLTDGTGFDVTPRVAPMPDGRAAIVWTTYNELGYREIAYATVDGSGSVTSGPIQITDNGSSGFESRRADVVALSDGRLAVAWTRETYGDQQIQYTIISGSEPPTPVTETPTATPETPTATPETPTATPTETPTPTPSLTPTTPPPRWVTIASQDFEGAFPGDWIVYEKYGSQHGNYEWGKRHCRRYAGGYSGWPVGGGVDGSALGCGDNYPNLAWSWLIYGPFSLTDATAAELRFKMWLNTEAGYDGLLWCASTDGQSFNCDSASGSTSGQWVDVAADLSSLDGVNYLGMPNVWVALIFYSDTYENEPEGAYADNILLRKFASPGHVQIEGGSSLEGLTPLEVPEQIRLPDEANDAIRGPGHDRPQPGNVGSPGHANWVIRTVPNDLSRANLYVSLTTDEDDNLIMTWLDNLGKQYVFYALAGSNGNIRTPATILQRTRHSSIWSSKNGQGNDVLIPGVIPQKPVTVYLPAVLKNYRSSPPVPPVINGGFESGEHGWTFGKDSSNSIRPAPRPDVVGSRAHSGSWAAVLGDENAPCEVEIGVEGYRLRSWISQDVRVPVSGTARLSFHYRMLTYDKWSADEFDRLEIYLDGTRIGNLGNTASNYGCGNPINDLGWREFTYDLSAYQGRTVRLKLVNVTDPDRTYSTWTYVDDVEVRP